MNNGFICKKSIFKVLCYILCFALISNIVFNLYGKTVRAAEGDGSMTLSGNVVYLSTNSSQKGIFYLMTDSDGSFFITNDYHDTSNKLIIPDNCSINIAANCYLTTYANYSFNKVTLQSASSKTSTSIDICGDSIISWNQLQGGYNCYVNNYATVTLSEFDVMDLCGDAHLQGFTNRGTIIADVISINHNGYTDTSNAKLCPTNHFYFSTQTTVNATVFVEENTTLYKSGDENQSDLTIGFENATKVFSGVISSKKPRVLFDDPDISLGSIPTTVYYGQDYEPEFIDSVSVETGYDKSKVYFEYSKPQGTLLSDKPTAKGDGYWVRVVAPSNDTFFEDISDWKQFNIDYLPESELGVSTPYFTVNGIVNGKYVPDDLLLTTVNGIQAGSTYAPDSDFSNSLTIDSSLMFRDGSLNDDYCIALRRTSDKATTAEHTLNYYYPSASELIYDPLDPEIKVQFVDGREMSVEDGILTGDTVSIEISDNNLDKIYINGNLYEHEEFEEGYMELELKSTKGKTTDYSIKATDLAGRSSTLEFTLFPNTTDAIFSVTVPEGPIYAGDEYDVDVKTNSDGAVTLQYKDADTDTVLSSKPTAEGNYTVTATAAETDFYFEATTSANYSIKKRTPDTTVTVPGIVYVGNDYEVETNTDSDGNITYQYYDKNNDSYLDTKPTSAGEYIVTVTTAETAKYYRSEKTATIKIIKRTADTTAIAPEVVYVGDDYDVTVDTTSNGNAYYQYYDKNNGSYLDGKPTSAGEYTVTVTVSETSLYYESEDTATFKIIKRDPTVSLSIPDTTVGQTYSPEFVTNSDSTSITYEYKVKGASDSTYSKTKPTAAGSYTIRVTVGSTEKFNEASATDNFTISKKAASVSLGIGTPYAGTTYTPSFSSNSDAASRAVFEYKEKNADDSKYSKTAPNTVGTYVVRVTIPETENYAETIVTADFRIIYLDAPQTAYLIEGQSGKNNFYVSDVVIKAPTGFTISAVYSGTYTASIPYKDGITSVYLKRTSDGALTNAIPIANAPRVDKSAPSISTPNGTIAPGSVIFTSDFTLNVSDPNLRSLKVNGEPIDLTNYKNGYTLTLNPGYGSQTYKVMAEDEAGNVTTLEFTLKAEWLKDKVIIPDVVLPLEGNESYNLGEGYWLVTRNTPEGPVTDDTVYSGNMPFYVNESGDYTFTKVN